MTQSKSDLSFVKRVLPRNENHKACFRLTIPCTKTKNKSCVVVVDNRVCYWTQRCDMSIYCINVTNIKSTKLPQWTRSHKDRHTDTERDHSFVDMIVACVYVLPNKSSFFHIVRLAHCWVIFQLQSNYVQSPQHLHTQHNTHKDSEGYTFMSWSSRSTWSLAVVTSLSEPRIVRSVVLFSRNREAPELSWMDLISLKLLQKKYELHSPRSTSMFFNVTSTFYRMHQ